MLLNTNDHVLLMIGHSQQWDHQMYNKYIADYSTEYIADYSS